MQKQSVDTVRTHEAEEEIETRRITKDPGIAILEIVIKDVIVRVQAGLIPQIIQKEKLDLLPGRSHEVLQAVRNQIQKLLRKKAKL